MSGDAVDQPDISAKAAVVYSPGTGEYIYEKSPDERLPMASTTKIMTTLLALEYVEVHGDVFVTVDEEIASTEGSSMGLEVGDEISLSALCAGMMLASGNDAANAVASVLSDDFPKLMNDRAGEMGMINSNFVTASGLDADGHFSTARDMSLLAAEAMKNGEFAALASSQTREISYHNGEKRATFTNHNKLLWYMDDCIGVKTGYTERAGRCLVSAVNRNGVTLICVTLDAPDDWSDHEKLYDYAYALLHSYSPRKTDFVLPTTEHPVICALEDGEIMSFSSSNILEKVYLPKFIYSSAYSKGDVVGRVDYISNENIISTRNIIIN